MRLLLAVDRSNFSQATMQAVITQYKPAETEVRIVHVVDLMNNPFPEMIECNAEIEHAPNIERESAEALVAERAKLPRANGFETTTTVDWGEPRTKILEVATHWNADTIVLGSHGKTGLDRFLVGGVSDAVMRHAHCSVEIVRVRATGHESKHSRERHPVSRILLAIDNSNFSQMATNMLISQTKKNNAEVRILCVQAPFPVSLAEKMGSNENPDFYRARLQLRDETSNLLSGTAEAFRSAGFNASHYVEEGDPRELILDYSERWPAELIVVGSRGLTGLRRFLMGSVSEAVARYARCSVEIVRTRSDA